MDKTENKLQEDALDLFKDRLSKDENIFTPSWICEEMIQQLQHTDKKIFNPDAKFLDLVCKTGRFLKAIMSELMKSPHMQSGTVKGIDGTLYNLVIPKERKEYILKEQLFGIVVNPEMESMIRRNLYGQLRRDIDNFIDIEKTENKIDLVKTKKSIKEKLKEMKFDVVVGNPPYNDDIYLDFVTVGHEISSKHTCMITPAKWQAKGGKKNEEFREQIVPYMSKITYFPDCTDIFKISEYSGICHYLIGKNKVGKKEINNICNKNTLLNSAVIREFGAGSTLSNVGQTIVNKISYTNGILNWLSTNIITDKKFCLVAPDIIANERGIEGVYQAYGIMSYKTKNCSIVRELHVVEDIRPEIDLSTADKIIYTSNSLDVCKSLISYTNTKFVRFLIFISISGRTPAYSGSAWRFVPDPGAFDHIFTDEELYNKYNLTKEEINIIESVIKERK